MMDDGAVLINHHSMLSSSSDYHQTSAGVSAVRGEIFLIQLHYSDDNNGIFSWKWLSVKLSSLLQFIISSSYSVSKNGPSDAFTST